MKNLLKLEELGMKPDELISWYLWAEDTGPDGQPRRSATDMYFAEVRPFEEIYRPGDSQSGEGSGSGAANVFLVLSIVLRRSCIVVPPPK